MNVLDVAQKHQDAAKRDTVTVGGYVAAELAKDLKEGARIMRMSQTKLLEECLRELPAVMKRLHAEFDSEIDEFASSRERSKGKAE